MPRSKSSRHHHIYPNKYCDKRCDGTSGKPFVIEEDMLNFDWRGEQPQFYVEKRGKNKITLRYRYKYLSVRPSGIAAFDALLPQEDTTLIVETLNTNQIALKSIYNKYLTIQPCNRNEETRKCGCFYGKPTFTASSREELEVWKIKCKDEPGKCYNNYLKFTYVFFFADYTNKKEIFYVRLEGIEHLKHRKCP